MIVFKKIKEYNNIETISQVSPKDFLFFGLPLDDRGDKIVSHLKAKYYEHMQIIYDNESDSFIIDQNTNNCKNIKRVDIKKDIESMFNKGNITTISFEATTLGYCELLTLLYTINSLNKNINIKVYYAEPEKYTSKKNNEEYELSEEYSNHKYIKPFVLPMPHDSTLNNKATLISLLGFEENRLGRVINDDENKYDQFISIFPIPGFKIGWENISLSKHHIFLENKEDIYYTPADNPYDTYKLLNKITKNLPEKRIVIMPIGTKPCTIGTVIFLINAKENNKQSRIATKYDFPTKKEGRSSGIDKIYEYICEIT